MAEWFESFFTGLYNKVLAKQYEQYDESRRSGQARVVKRLLRLRRHDRVLDVPSGTGRIALPLARMGLAVTGVDLTTRFLGRARDDARREGLNIRLIHGDMRRIEFDGEFDVAFNWGGSFGYFSDSDNLAFCRSILRALRPGGRFLVEGLNRWWLLSNFRSRTEQTVDNVYIDHRNRYDTRSHRIRSTWTLRKGQDVHRQRLSIKIFNGPEMRKLLRSAGFDQIELFGYPPLGRFTRHSRSLIAVATRPRR